MGYNFQSGPGAGFQWAGRQVQLKIVSEPFMLTRSFWMETMALSEVDVISFPGLVSAADTKLRRQHTVLQVTSHPTTGERKRLSVMLARCGEPGNLAVWTARTSRSPACLLLA